MAALDLLGAYDDAIQVRSLLAVSAMQAGDNDLAERYITEIDGLSRHRPVFGGSFVTGMARAELALARGHVDEGLRLYRVAVAELREVTYPGMGDRTGLEPWTLFGESAGVVAFALHGQGDDGVDLYESLRAKVVRVVDPDRPHLDYPVAGLVLYGLGAWGLLKDTLPVEDAVRLLVVADLFAYARYTLTLHPSHTLAEAERRAPGLAARDPRRVRRAQGPGPHRRGPGPGGAGGPCCRLGGDARPDHRQAQRELAGERRGHRDLRGRGAPGGRCEEHLHGLRRAGRDAHRGAPGAVRELVRRGGRHDQRDRDRARGVVGEPGRLRARAADREVREVELGRRQRDRPGRHRERPAGGRHVLPGRSRPRGRGRRGGGP